MKWTASAAALLVASAALAQTPAPAPAPEAAPPPAAAAPAPAPAAPAAPAPAAKPPAPTFTFALKGFVSMSAAYQRGAFILSEGQQSLGSATGLGQRDKDSLTFDVRQSRFNFSVKGPQVLFGATPTAVLELDFMQGFGAGNFGDVSLLNRVRTLYSELNWGSHRLQLGQQNDLIFAMAPTSLSHIAFPLGYFTGNAGWRRPGVFGYHQLALPSDLKVEAAWEVGRGQWADSAACVTTPVAGTTGCSGVGGAAAGTSGGINLGEATAGPAVEGRVTVSWSKFVNAFVATHYNRVDLTGYNDANPFLGTAPNTTHTIAVASYHAGAKLTLPIPVEGMGLIVQGTGFTGKNVYPLIANFDTGTAPNATNNFGTFRLGDANNPDIWTTGYWAQLGLNVTKELSVWGLYGNQKIDRKGFVRSFGGAQPAAATRYENTTTNLILMYREGGYGLSAEWINFLTKYAVNTDPTALRVTNHRNSSADQFIVTANYFF